MVLILSLHSTLTLSLALTLIAVDDSLWIQGQCVSGRRQEGGNGSHVQYHEGDERAFQGHQFRGMQHLGAASGISHEEAGLWPGLDNAEA